MRLCDATIPDVPSAVGWTGVAYSLGYIARWASMARRSFSSASGSGIVRIHVIGSYWFESVRSTKHEKIHGHAEGDDPDAEGRAQRIVAGEQQEQHSDQDQEHNW